MDKVIVIGCPGAGKSTFSRRLRSDNKCKEADGILTGTNFYKDFT